MKLLPIKRALLSVTNKEGLLDLAKALHSYDVELVSTGGTMQALKRADYPVLAVSNFTNFPEILDGRVKTLHPHIHGGILADKDNADHLRTLAEYKIAAFDLVCVNLYDFASAMSKGFDLQQMIEEIDIGGPCLLRAAAKNFQSLVVLPNIEAYPEFLAELAQHAGKISLGFRKRMAFQAFSLTASYDKMVAKYFESCL